MTTTEIDIPNRLKRFPLWLGKYPIFFTVTVRDGVPDFRVLSRRKQIECYHKNWCHLCGQPLKSADGGRAMVWFILEPTEFEFRMTYQNGPMHRECAQYAARACPYLANADYVGKKLINTANPFAVKTGQAGKPFGQRPAKFALVGVLEYRTDTTLQYPMNYLGEYAVVDWDVCPQRPE